MTEYKITGGLKLFVYYFFVGTTVILTNFTLNGKSLVVKRRKSQQNVIIYDIYHKDHTQILLFIHNIRRSKF